MIKHYYDVFNRTLAEFGLVLKHLGTTFNDFLYEVKRAMRGQFLCVAFIIPIGNFLVILGGVPGRVVKSAFCFIRAPLGN